MKSKHVLAAVMVLGALAAVGTGVHAISLRFVEWGEPLPWEDGVPYLVSGLEVAPETIVTIGGHPIGRVAVEIEPSQRFGNLPRRELRKLAVMRVDRKTRLTADSHFWLRSFDGRPIISVAVGSGEPLEPWDHVTIERPAEAP